MRAAPSSARCLGKESRLRSSFLFAEAFAQSDGVAGRFLVLWRRQGEAAAGRLGVVAAKRTFRRAVDRNRAKRLLREVFRVNRYRLNTRFDYVIVARRRILNAGISEIQRDLLATAGRAGVLAEPVCGGALE